MNRGLVVLLAGIVGWALVRPVSAEESARFREDVLYSFCSEQNCTDGRLPFGDLIAVKGKLYGTTLGGGVEDHHCSFAGCGTVFSVDRKTGSEQVLYAFCAQSGCVDGANPYAGVINTNGILYGTTDGGGAARCGTVGCGTVFSLDLGTGAETVQVDFTGDTQSGEYPVADLIAVNGRLYGTAFDMVFWLDPRSGLRVLHNFTGYPTDGTQPMAGLVALNGILYGTTYGGGSGSCASGCGTVFSVDPRSGGETVIHSFTGYPADGAHPEAGLIAVNGTLFGTTVSGGGPQCAETGCGTVFSINPASGLERVMYSFCHQQGCTDGNGPVARLIAANGAFYGTTQAGGKVGGCSSGSGCGTVFAFDGNAETVVHTFCLKPSGCIDGSQPSAGLIAADGKFYGTTEAGGAHNDGTVFLLRKEPWERTQIVAGRTTQGPGSHVHPVRCTTVSAPMKNDLPNQGIGQSREHCRKAALLRC